MLFAYERGFAALQFLVDNQLDPNAANYALAIRLQEGTSERLNSDVDALIAQDGRLTPEAAATLRNRFLGSDLDVSPDRCGRVCGLDCEELTNLLRRSHIEIQSAASGLAAMLTAQGNQDRIRAHTDLDGLAMMDDPCCDPETAFDSTTRMLARQAGADLLDRLIAKGDQPMIAYCVLDEAATLAARHGVTVLDNVMKALAANALEQCENVQVCRWDAGQLLLILPATPILRVRLMLDETRLAFGRRRFRLRGSGALIGSMTISCAIGATGSTGRDTAIAACQHAADAASRGGGNRVVG